MVRGAARRGGGPLPGGLRALDRGRLVADADRDPARLALLGLGDADLEDALVERRRDLLGVDALRERQRAAELAEGALHPVVALLLRLVLGLALAAYGEDVVLELDRDVGLGQAGQVRAKDEVLAGLDEVHRGHPTPHAAAVAVAAGRRGVEERVEETVHLTLERAQLANGLPAHECHLRYLLYHVRC